MLFTADANCWPVFYTSLSARKHRGTPWWRARMTLPRLLMPDSWFSVVRLPLLFDLRCPALSGREIDDDVAAELLWMLRKRLEICATLIQLRYRVSLKLSACWLTYNTLKLCLSLLFFILRIRHFRVIRNSANFKSCVSFILIIFTIISIFYFIIAVSIIFCCSISDYFSYFVLNMEVEYHYYYPIILLFTGSKPCSTIRITMTNRTDAKSLQNN